MMVIRYDLTEDCVSGAVNITPVPDSHEGSYVSYEDYAKLADAVRYLRNLCDDKDYNINKAIGALSGIMYVFGIKR